MTPRDWDAWADPNDHEDRRKGSIVLEIEGIKTNIAAAELLLNGKARLVGELYMNLVNLEATVRAAKRFIREAEVGERLRSPHEEMQIGRQLNIDLNTVTANLALLAANQ